jgi:NitT/TauT family transport system ATP-binding protein
MPTANEEPPALRLADVTKSYGLGAERTEALAGVALDVGEGEFVAIVGPSGCGKSTLLQIAAGLLTPSGGSASFRGTPIGAPAPGIVYLFQQYAKSLFPWRTVRDNVAFAIEHRPGTTRAAARAQAAGYLRSVGLEGAEERYPWQLSGGMQQRATIARALAAQPAVLLMDEPFSSVDALTRHELHALVQTLREHRRMTAVLVTHDVDEAVFLADRVVLLSPRPARVVQVFETALPRPREPIATRELPRFVELRHALLERLLGR